MVCPTMTAHTMKPSSAITPANGSGTVMSVMPITNSAAVKADEVSNGGLCSAHVIGRAKAVRTNWHMKTKKS